MTFEGKGVLDAKDRLTRVSGDVREPFPKAVADAKVRQCKALTLFQFAGPQLHSLTKHVWPQVCPQTSHACSNWSTSFPLLLVQVDTLVMKHFLSGFSDDDAKLILKHCSEVLPKTANILLLQVSYPWVHVRLSTCAHLLSG